MSQFNRFCQLQNHEEYCATHICCYDQCKQSQRWLCSQCFNEKIHNHEEQPNCVKDRSQFNNLFQKDCELLYDKIKVQRNLEIGQLKAIINSFKELTKILNTLQQWVENTLKSLSDQEILNNLNESKSIPFINLTNQQINQILSINKTDIIKYLDIQSIEESFQKLPTIWDQVQSELNKMKQNYLQQSITLKYQLQDLVKLKKQGNCQSPIISSDDKYIVYSQDYILKIYNTKDQTTKKFQLDSSININRFSPVDQQLFVGCQSGNIYIFNMIDDRQIHIGPIFIHNSAIKNLIQLSDQHLITCSEKGSIIKFDIEQKQVINRVKAHQEWTHCLEYISENNIIISASDDKSIKFWDSQNLTNLLNIQNAHNSPIRQIQMIRNNSQLLTQDELGILQLWKIEQDNIILLNHVIQGEYLRCYSVMNDQLIVRLSGSKLQILDFQQKVFQEIQIQEKYQSKLLFIIRKTKLRLYLYDGQQLSCLDAFWQFIDIIVDKIQILKPKY